MKREELLTRPIVAAIQAHALEEYPRESMGLIVSGEYKRLDNVNPQPELHGQVAMGQYLETIGAGELQAVVHSHPNGPNCPSAQDMLSQQHMEVPFVIVSCNATACLKPFAWGDQLEPLPLVGRGFQHGVSDCYGLVRDYFRVERGIIIPEFPRDWLWWLNGQSLYVDGFQEAGFREIDASEVRVGDCFMAAIRSKTPNHAGIVVEPGVILHHGSADSPFEPSKLSKRDTIHRWLPYITHWVRYGNG